MGMSEFRKKKLFYVFNTFFDVNQSGTIDKKDFDLAVQRICDARKLTDNDPKYKQTRDTLWNVWEGLIKHADADKDGQITCEEFCSVWEDYAEDPAHAPEWQQTYMKFMFDLHDASGDGAIDMNEFSDVCNRHGVPENEARIAFQKLGVGNAVTKDKFCELFKQYFTSDDPASAGNFIFGKVNF